MALAKKQSRSSSIIAISIVILIVGVIGYFVYTRFLAGSLNNQNGTGAIGDRSALNFNQAILNDARVINLQDYGRTTTANVNDAGQIEPFR